jgi:hypothetical protein
MKKLSLRIAMGCSLVIPCLVGVMAITTAQSSAQDYYTTQVNPSREDLSKSCGACKKPVSLNAKSDDFCPHCQIKWISVNSIRIPLTPSTTPDPPPTKAPDPPEYTGFPGMPGAPQTHPSRPVRPTRPSRKSDSQPPVLLAPAQSPPTAESGIFRQSTDGTLEKVTP